MTSQPRRRAWRVCVAVTLAATALTACGGGDATDTVATAQGTDRAKAQLTLASPAPDSLFTFNDVIARELGFYEDEGLEVKLAPVSDNIPIAGLVENGNADVGLVSATDAVTAATKSDEVKVPYDERTSGNGFLLGVVAPADGDVKAAADLEGKTVGLSSPDQDRAYLAAVLDAVGLSIDDVQTTVVGPGGPAVAESLKSGRIAAYAGTLSDFFAFDEAGLEVEDLTPDGLESVPVGAYVVRANELQDGDVVTRFFRALAKGTYVGIERPAVAEAATRKVAPEQWREPELARRLLEGLSATLEPFDGKTFGELRPRRWEALQQLLLETGAISSKVDMNDLLVTDLTAAINDFDRKAALAEADRWLAANGGK